MIFLYIDNILGDIILYKYWYIENSKDIFTTLVKATYQVPFKESVFIYFLESSRESSLPNFSNIKYTLNITEKLTQNDATISIIPKKILLAIINIALKTHTALLFAHTHPSISFYPKKMKLSLLKKPTYCIHYFQINKLTYSVLRVLIHFA